MHKIKQGNVEVRLEVTAGKPANMEAARQHLGKECIFNRNNEDTIGVITDISTGYGSSYTAVVVAKTDISKKAKAQSYRYPFETLRLIPETRKDFEELKLALSKSEKDIALFVQCADELERERVSTIEFEIWKSFRDFGNKEVDKAELYRKIRSFIKEMGLTG